MALGQPPPSCRSQQLSRGNGFIWVVEQKAMGQPSWGRCQTFSITSSGSAPGPAGEMQVMLIHLWTQLLMVQAVPWDPQPPSHTQLPP